MSGEKKLIRKLLEDYLREGKIGRPVKNVQDTIVVKYGLALIQILSLDEKNQILTINVWAKYTWLDQLLQWEPKNFSGVEEVRIPPDKIWTPDIVLYNYADERLIEKRDVMVIVNYNGRIIWLPPAIFKSTCSINISNFPFDFQTCHLKFGSWTYKGDKLDIQLYENLSEIDIKDYTASNEWKILHRPARRYVMHFPNDSSVRPDVTFFLFLKRNSAYHAYLLVVPCVLLSSLTLVIFWLPPESAAKMILGMNIFVAFSLLLRLLAETTPSASTSVPYLGYYYCLNMILITLSTFLSIIVINLYFRCDKRKNLPDWLRKSVNLASRVMGMSQVISCADWEKLQMIKSEIRNSRNHVLRRQQKQQQQPANHHNQQQRHDCRSQSRDTIPTPLSPNARQLFGGCQGTQAVTMEMHNMAVPTYGSQQNSAAPPTTETRQRRNTTYRQGDRGSSAAAADVDGGGEPAAVAAAAAAVMLEENLGEIRKALRSLMTKIAEKDRGNRIAREWRTVAMVLDRVFFWLYLCTIIVSGLILLVPRGLQESKDKVLHRHAMKYEEYSQHSISSVVT